ncbi:MAG: hypothetical protein II826_09340 [Prevotella sp.]|nr:hypothetical protein [Prevotella sp.]
MALKHITLHVTRQEADDSGRRKTVRIKVAESDVPELSGGKGMRSVPLLLTHALSIGGEGVTERTGFNYLFREPVAGDPDGGGFVLGEEAGFPYSFGVATDDPDVWGFVLE